MEYGLIFHGTRTGKYCCKNMKYRINIIYIYPRFSIEQTRECLDRSLRSLANNIYQNLNESTTVCSLRSLRSLALNYMLLYVVCLSYVTLLRKNDLIAGLAKIDFFPEMASTKLRYYLSKI